MVLHTQMGAAYGSGMVTAIQGMVSAIPRFQLDYNSFHVLQRLTQLKSLPLTGNSRFASHLALYFPEVAERIDEGDFGILHLEVGALKLATQNAILHHHWEAVRQHFSFVDKTLENAGTELRDALQISYLGNLFYGETSHDYAKARSLLPKQLSLALMAIEHHYELLVS